MRLANITELNTCLEEITVLHLGLVHLAAYSYQINHLKLCSFGVKTMYFLLAVCFKCT